MAPQPRLGPGTALLLVDYQLDFMDEHPAGPVPVPGARRLCPVLNRLMAAARRARAAVVASQDWHLQSHVSFITSHPAQLDGGWELVGGASGRTVEVEVGGRRTALRLFPSHCVAGTSGAQFAEGLDIQLIQHSVHKGMAEGVEAYSAFHDMARSSTGLTGWLRQRGVSTLFVCGVATEFCVRATVLDSLAEGFATVLLTDAVAGVDAAACQDAVRDMQQQGAVLMTGAELIGGDAHAGR